MHAFDAAAAAAMVARAEGRAMSTLRITVEWPDGGYHGRE